jgi:hypothetical protein
MSYELKTKKTDASVEAFLNTIEPEQKRKDAFEILDMMKKLTKAKPKMWGDTIIGLGAYSYTNSTGKSFDWFRIGFSPRKQNLTLYIMPGYLKIDHLLQKLGKHKTGKSCLYIKKLEDVDKKVLLDIMKFGLKEMEEKYGK